MRKHSRRKKLIDDLNRPLTATERKAISYVRVEDVPGYCPDPEMVYHAIKGGWFSVEQLRKRSSRQVRPAYHLKFVIRFKDGVIPFILHKKANGGIYCCEVDLAAFEELAPKSGLPPSFRLGPWTEPPA